MKSLLSPQAEAQAGSPWLDLIALVLHEQEEVAEVVGVRDGGPADRASSMERKVGWPLDWRSHSM